ncbi:MAG: hypothetical protein H6605_07855 [Flavobacteriales bacterium]|nr:hypothetical protein [Flavobacteriales bacterium]
MKYRIYIVLLLCPQLFFTGCTKEDSGSDNPYDTWNYNERGPVMKDLPIDPNSIQGLHKNIFKPTCSNAGCHDGNFEPDFRTIESSYNSLINRNAINYDPDNPQISKRVDPGSAASSMVLHRINTLIQGTQGIMPLTLDPESDWTFKKTQYIKNIENWINDGAKDQFGNTAASQDFPPQLNGFIVFADNSPTPLPQSGKNPISIPGGTSNLKIMFSFADDKTKSEDLSSASLNYSLNPFEYTNPELSLKTESSPVMAKGINGNQVEYWHSYSTSVSALGAMPNDVLWMRATVNDNVNPNTPIPSVNAAFTTKKYVAVIVR